MAEIICTGAALGFRVGARLSEVAEYMPLQYADDIQGKRENRVLRRDYGILEATCIDQPDWVIQSVTIQVHRLASLPGLRRSMSEILQVDCEPYIAWREVEGEIRKRADLRLVERELNYPGYRFVHADSTGVSAYVVKDPEVERGTYPADGDLWSLEIISPDFMS
ncbi:hypothetical protein AB0899_30530 [Streptomyces sp. NPDC007002]|uniref:hypothetical protein n=1 Tax=Streptomyces sp. NPDC007002 TaxID=3156910 RepID=UPI0034563E65